MSFRPIDCIAAFVLALAVGLAGAAPAVQEPFVLAVHPYLPAAEITKRFAPLADYLGGVLGRPVAVRVGGNYDEHITAIGRDQVDIAFLGPVEFTRVVANYGRKPALARFEVDGKRNLEGVVFVRSDSPVRTLADLKGRRMAFGDPESTMSHVVPRAMLVEAGVPARSLAEVRFLGSHQNVALAVLGGDFDAGAVKREVFDEFAPRGLRALARTPPTPDHLFVTRSTLPAQDVERLRAALLALASKPGGPAILDRLHKGLTALVPARESDYDALKATVRRVDADGR